ncbi:MAG: hypothetical protein JRG91_21250, partial [Deltaproteobacteria bacterium]|nr:hypothetical protein [Deltaproteobacteria bacterium]
LGGCHSSQSLLGDAIMDTTTEIVDAVTDVAVDPGTDAGPPDVGPDAGIDVVPACPEPDPSPDGPNPYFEIDGTYWPVDEGEILVYGIIESVAVGDDNSFTVFLTSDAGERHSIYVRSNAPFWLYAIEGEPVELWYTWGGGYWYNDRWFALRYAWGGLIMAGGEGRTLPISGSDPMLYPVELTVLEGMCGPETDFCGTLERRGLRVGLYGETRDFYPRSYGSVGSMESAQVHVGHSYRYLDMECDDMPDQLVSGLIFMVPEG